VRLSDYVTVTSMTFDKQSNARQTAVESKSHRRLYRITVTVVWNKTASETSYGR